MQHPIAIAFSLRTIVTFCERAGRCARGSFNPVINTMKRILVVVLFVLALLSADSLAPEARAALLGSGGYTNAFTTLPPATDWAGGSIGGAAGDVTTAGGIDTEVSAVNIATLTAAVTTGVNEPPDFNASATWAPTGLYLQTRSTGVRVTLLLLTLTNGLGGAANSVNLGYDYTKNPVATEEVDGQRAYFSLTGAAGSWTNIAAFSSAAPGRLTATLNINWPENAPLYILWADDNGSPSPDGGYQIDNFSASASVAVQSPVAITNQPQSIAVAELAPASFSVGAGGYQPVTYQWFTNNVAVTDATNASYVIASTPLSHHGLNFTVIAQNVASNTTYYATSSVATLTVNADTTAPVLMFANIAGLNQIVATFSERLALASITNIANYAVTSTAGNLTISGASLDVTETNVVLDVSSMTPGVTYTLRVNNVTDKSAAANAVAPNSTVQFTAVVISVANVGAPSFSGTATPSGNGYDVTGAGTNILGAADQFTFAYQQLTGDFDVKLRLTAFSAADAWARAGLMARETLNADSRFAATLASPALAPTVFEARTTPAAAATISGSFPANYPYTWLRLARSGNNFTGYASFDGTTWVQLGTVANTMPGTIYVGYAVSSGSASIATTGSFRDYGSAAGGTVVTSPTFTREPLGPSTRRTGLVISEIMYHPKARLDGKTVEFVELYNSMSIFEDIGGYRLSGDINYTFPTGTVMQAGQFIVLAKVAADVQSVYGISGVFQYGVTNGFTTNVNGNVTNVVPNIENSLNNGGGTVRLHNRAGAVLLEAGFSTKYPWPIAADGGGHSLVLARPSYGERDRRAWAASDMMGGSPGTVDSLGPELAREVMINEFRANTDLPATDMVELYNHSTASVNLSGYWLSDTVTTNKFRIPNGTVLGPRGFVSFTEVQLGFALSSSGEQIVLVNSNQNRVIDAIGFDGQQNGVSTGRFPDGAPALKRLTTVTPGTTNTAPRQSDVVINEVMYNPISGNNDDEYVELYNRSTNAVDLSDWKFSDGISFNFPAGTVIAGRGYMVVAKNATRLQGNYNNLGTSNLVGNYNGTLANSGEHLELSAPDYIVTTNGLGQPVTNVSHHYVINDLSYGKGGNWPYWADGGGSSMELIDANADISLPSNWADSDERSKASWTSFEFTGTVDNGLTGQGSGDRLQIFMLGLGECEVDDVELRPNGTNANIIANGNFEGGITGWTLQGSHDQSYVDNAGFTGNGLHILAQSRGDNGANRIYAIIGAPVTTGTATLRAKVRWMRGFPEILMRLRGGTLEAFGRMPVPANLGTPGLANSRTVTNAGPAVFDVTHSPVLPQVGESVRVTARAHDPHGLNRLVLRYRPDGGAYANVNMTDDGLGADAVAADGLFSATIPAQSAGAMIAFYIEAVDIFNVTNNFPANPNTRVFPNDAPGHEALIRWGEVQMPGSFATYHLWISAVVNTRWSTRDRLNNAQLDGTYVYNNYRVVYNAKPQYGGSPWHNGAMQGPVNPSVRVDYVMNLADEDRVLGATDFIFNNVGNPSGNDSSDTSGMAEQCSYEIFKGAGLVFNYRRYMHLFVNGNQRSISGNIAGNFIMEDSQQPNGDMIEQWFPDDSEGQLYKIEDWFEFNDVATGFSNDDADLQRRETTYNGVTTVKLAPYRFMWRKRSISAGDSANDYTNLMAMIDIVSPRTAPTVNPLNDTMVKQFGLVADFEQWMRIFAVQHTVGNWDAYGYNRGKNAYTYRPNRGRFEQMTWDIDFTMGVGGDGATTGLFGYSDQRVGAMYNTPEILRAAWRAYKDIINGPLNNSYLDPLLDARAAAFRANNVTHNVGTIGTIKSYISARRSYIEGQLNAVGGTWAIANTNLTSTSNLVTLTGTAPIDVKFIEINGVSYPVTWTSTTAWSVRIPMGVAGTNNFTVAAFDRLTNAIAGSARTVTVNYTGVIEGPETNIVINELMYNPLVPGSDYIELFNRSATFTFDLSGWRLNGLDYTFPEGSTLGPRTYLVLTRDRVNFASVYGGSIAIFDQFPGNLDSGGETITLIKPGLTPAQDVIIDKVRYDNKAPWSTFADGTGSSLQVIDNAQDNVRVGNWNALYIPAVYTGGVSTPAVTNIGWRFVSMSTNASTTPRLLIYLDGPGTVFLDDIVLVPGTNAGVGTNMVNNGDFEQPLTSAPQVTNGWSLGTNMTATVISSEVVHSGGGALKLVVQGAFSVATNKMFYQNLGPVAPVSAQPHTLSFWCWATNTTGSSNLTARLQAASLNIVTNIGVIITPSNYVPPGLVSAATNYASPGASNQVATVIPAFQTLWINEVQAENLTGPLDSFGERGPWIELHNPSSNSVSLDGLYLSDNYTNLTNWAFPAGQSIPAGGFRVVFCDGQPGQTTNTELHTSFALPAGSGSIAISRIHSGKTQVLDYVDYAALHANYSYGSFPDGQPFDRQEFFYVTPGGTNDPRSAPIVVFINEWMASNTNYLHDPADDDYDDWFEIYNPGPGSVDLAGYYLTDVLTNKTKYLITTNGPHIIPAGGHLLVWADNETGQNMAGSTPRPDLHVSFSLAAAGEAIGLFAADGTQIDAVTFTNQVGNISEGRCPDGSATIITMTNPTPRAVNIGCGTINTPPVLGVIPVQTVYLGETVTFTASAADTDLPAQSITYTIESGPPGASIGPVSGAFTWLPSQVGTNTVVVRATDNGVPPLDDSQTVTMRVLSLPAIGEVSRTGNDLTVTWATTPGKKYRVQYKNNLNDAGWTNLGQVLEAASTSLTLTDDTTGLPQRFYRLMIVP
jgi:hypothetical protein